MRVKPNAAGRRGLRGATATADQSEETTATQRDLGSTFQSFGDAKRLPATSTKGWLPRDDRFMSQQCLPSAISIGLPGHPGVCKLHSFQPSCNMDTIRTPESHD